MAQKSRFRRILSPHRNKDVEKEKEKERQIQIRRSFTAGAAASSQSNGHEHNNDEVTRIENTAYGDPDALSSRSTTNSAAENPPLPPRNVRPASVGQHPFQFSHRTNDEDESPMYVAPADTLRKGVVNPSVHTPQAEPQALLLGGGDGGAVPTKTEKKKMQIHQLTMSQKRDQDPGHSRTRSTGHVIDSSDYSTPFDLLQQSKKDKGMKGHSISVPGLMIPPPKPPHARVRQQVVGTGDDSDPIIPVISPPPVILSDRDQSNSPSSPLSTPSSEHEIPEYPPDDGTNDYDEPWDRKFKHFHQFQRPMKRVDNQEESEHHRDHQHHNNHSRDSPPHPHHHHQTHEDVQLKSSFKERAPSPGGYELQRGAGKSVSAKELGGRGGVRKISPQPPEVPSDLNRPQLPRRTWGREGSTSPIQSGGIVGSGRVQQIQQLQGRSYSQSQSYRRELSSDFPPEIGPRTSSVSMTNRKLPSPPGELPPPPPPPTTQPPPPTENRRASRNASPPTSMIIDTSIPLTDQPWYHGSIKRTDAEVILQDQPDFSFLVRNSESCKTDFSLSIRDVASGYIHLRIVFEGDSSPGQPGYVLGQFSSHFQTVPECIAFYLKQRLNIRGTEHKRLRYPVPRSMNHMASFRI